MHMHPLNGSFTSGICRVDLTPMRKLDHRDEA
jgi:hypothetical protein